MQRTSGRGQPPALQHEASRRKGSLCLGSSEGPKLVGCIIWTPLIQASKPLPRRRRQAASTYFGREYNPRLVREAPGFPRITCWLISSAIDNVAENLRFCSDVLLDGTEMGKTRSKPEQEEQALAKPRMSTAPGIEHWWEYEAPLLPQWASLDRCLLSSPLCPALG